MEHQYLSARRIIATTALEVVTISRAGRVVFIPFSSLVNVVLKFLKNLVFSLILIGAKNV
jgi:hypothetical protein